MEAIAYLIVGVIVLMVAVPIVLFGAVIIGTVVHVAVSIGLEILSFFTRKKGE
jgi:hypothetical protein